MYASVCQVFIGNAICEHGSVKLLKTGLRDRVTSERGFVRVCLSESECVISVRLIRRVGVETEVCVHLSPAHYSGCVSHHYQREHTLTLTHTWNLQLHARFLPPFTLRLCHFINCSARQCRARPHTRHQSINTSVQIRWIEQTEGCRTLNPWTPHPCPQQP